MSDIDHALRDKLISLVDAMGYEFVGCELQKQGRGSILRIYIDTENGITLDDCTKVSRQVSAMLDVEDPIPGDYSLEISSPGLNRPLFEVSHYKKYLGNQIKVRMHIPVDDQRNFVGKLLRVNESDIHLLVNNQEVVLPFSSIKKANIIN